LGLSFTGKVGMGQIESMALSAMMQGWSSEELTNNLAKMWTGNWESTRGKYTGQAATYKDQIDQIANDYGVPFTNGGQQAWVQGMLTGNITGEQYKQHAIAQAQSIYKGVAGEINANTTLKQIADPYVATMANLLELDPGSINYQNPTVKRALQGQAQLGDIVAKGPGSKTGNQAANYSATPLWQFEQQVRADPRWAQTQNARDTMSTALVKIGQDFGFGPNG
jgi:hypothetical protein